MVFDLAIIVLGAVLVPVVILRIGTPSLEASAVAALAGVEMTLIGVVGYALQGDDILEFVRFERTAGFGRAFVVGLAWNAGCFTLLLMSAWKKLRSMFHGSKSTKDKGISD